MMLLFVSMVKLAIQRINCLKFLGVYIDNDLNWKKHTSETSVKISKSLGILKCSFSQNTDYFVLYYDTSIPDVL